MRLIHFGCLCLIALLSVPEINAQWVQTNGPYTGFIYSLASSADGAAGTYLFAGTSGGFFYSTNKGTDWFEGNSGLTNLDVYALAVGTHAGGGSDLCAGTWGGGVWKRPLSELITSVDPVASELPHEFLLHQNYPNPFNPTTMIKYQTPHSSDVTMKVHDVLGREVSVLVNERRGAGVHEVKFDGSGLASDVYFYRLSAGSFVETKKLLLLR
jgi:hypothetical protein